MAKRLGMCVEMELMGATLTDKTYFDKYMGYLTEGVTQGYMTETVHIYYQDILAYYNACYAEDDMARLVYTYTYDFINGRLNTAPEREPDSRLSAEAGKPLSGTFNESASTARTYRVETSPANGSVTLTPRRQIHLLSAERLYGRRQLHIRHQQPPRRKHSDHRDRIGRIIESPGRGRPEGRDSASFRRPRPL